MQKVEKDLVEQVRPPDLSVIAVYIAGVLASAQVNINCVCVCFIGVLCFTGTLDLCADGKRIRGTAFDSREFPVGSSDVPDECYDRLGLLKSHCRVVLRTPKRASHKHCPHCPVGRWDKFDFRAESSLDFAWGRCFLISGLTSPKAPVRCVTCALFMAMLGNVPDNVVLSRITPALVTLASDPDM